MSRVLAIARETGELAALAGGTLAKMSERNDELFIAEAPFASGASDDGARDRAGAELAATVGATWLGSTSVASDHDGRPARDPLVDVIRTARPDLIVVPSPEFDGPLPLLELVFNAAYCSTIPNYISPGGLEAARTRAPMVTTDQPRSRNFQPDTYVDVTEQWPRKLEILDAADSGTNDLRELAETSSRMRGIQVQVEFAEAFLYKKVWGRLRPHRLFP